MRYKCSLCGKTYKKINGWIHKHFEKYHQDKNLKVTRIEIDFNYKK